MPNESNGITHDTLASELERLEVELKNLEIAQKKKEVDHPARINWTIAGPIMVAIIAGLFGFWQSSSNNRQSAKSQLDIERLKAKNELILEAVKTGIDDPQRANDNIKFFLDAGLIDDPDGRIKKLIDEKRNPVLPASTTSTWSAGCPFDPSTMTLGDLLERFEGQPVPDTAITKLKQQISGLVTTNLSDKQIDALISLAYNAGLGSLTGSKLIQRVDARDFVGAAGEFPTFRIPQAAPAGLAMRRLCERDLFLAGSIAK